MKKTLTAIAVVLVYIICACAACAEHNHTAADGFDRNAAQHWQVCECGEIFNAEDHTLDDICCTVCGSEVWLYDDGSADVCNYNEYGDMVRNTLYDGNGEATADYFYIFEYDENGNRLSAVTRLSDFVLEETTYIVNGYGENIAVQTVSCNADDGSRTHVTNDENGNTLSTVIYGPDMHVVYEETWEYTLDANGSITETHVVGAYDTGDGYEYVYDMYGNETYSCFYDTDGSVTLEIKAEYGYDADGRVLWVRKYTDGRIAYELVYCDDPAEYDEWAFAVSETEYLEDGSYIVYEYNKDGDTVRYTEFDADGKIISAYSAPGFDINAE